MIMGGAGGLGRGGKFSKAKGKEGVLQNQSLPEPCRLASGPLPDNYALWGHQPCLDIKDSPEAPTTRVTLGKLTASSSDA